MYILSRRDAEEALAYLPSSDVRVSFKTRAERASEEFLVNALRQGPDESSRDWRIRISGFAAAVQFVGLRIPGSEVTMCLYEKLGMVSRELLDTAGAFGEDHR